MSDRKNIYPKHEYEVRDFIDKEDSTAVIDFLIDYFNRPDIPELYSEHLASIPVEKVHDLKKKEGVAGRYERTFKDGEMHKEIKLEANPQSRAWSSPGGHIVIQPEVWERFNEGSSDKVIKYARYPKATVIHEALGHGLLDVLYGYHRKPHFTRTETFPIMLASYAGLASLKRSMDKDPHMAMINEQEYNMLLDSFNELKRLSDERLSLPERKFDMSNPNAPQLREHYE